MVAAHKSVLMRLEIRPAGNLCRCKHDKKHTIAKGEPRLVVRETGPGTPEQGYCADCEIAMLNRASRRIDELREEVRAQMV